MTYPVYADLTGKTVLITGGASGIGAAFVRAFLMQGCNVAFVSRPSDHGKKLCKMLEAETGHRPFFLPCDVRDIEGIRAAVEEIGAKFGAVDVLINNAARDDRHGMENYEAEQWDDSLAINLRPHYFTVQACLPGMKKHGGSVINLGSNSAILGLPGYASYVAAKAGIVGLSKALARELGEYKIRVNTLIPGWVLTDRQKELWATPEAIEECLDQQSLKQTISEEDIANAALFLASDASSMITGQSIIVDGGRV